MTYNAVVDVANPKLALRPGMTANLEVVYAERADVVRVANAALRFRPAVALAAAPPPAIAPITRPAGCRVASSSASRSRAPWSTIPS